MSSMIMARGTDANSRLQMTQDVTVTAANNAIGPASHATAPSAKYMDRKPRLKFTAERMFSYAALDAMGCAIGSAGSFGTAAIITEQ